MLNPTSFRLNRRAEQVYLLLTPDGGGPEMFPLRQSRQEEWRVELRLLPGRYRFRYYSVADGGQLMVYQSPAQEYWPIELDGLDGVLCVGDGD